MRVSIFALVLLLAAACTSTTSGEPRTPPGARVVCQLNGAGNPHRDVAVLQARARHLASGSAAVVTTSGARVTVSVPGAAVAEVRDLCRAGMLAYRPLVAPAVPSSGAGSTAALGGLPFPVPTSEPAYDAMPANDRAKLAAVLAGTACPSVTRGDATAVCDTSTPPSKVALLGAPIVTGDQVAAATAVPPSSNSPQWSVQITLRTPGRATWARYTAAHNTAGQATGDASTCSPSSVPCADYVGFVLDGRLLSLPVTTSTIDGPTQVTGNFTARTAKALAAGLSAGRLPVPLAFVSAKRTK